MNDVNEQLFTFTLDKQPTSVFFDMNNQIVLKEASLSVGINIPNIVETGFRLSQNYPNPVSKITTISYSLPADANIDLAVFDLAGNKLLELAKGRQGRGTHVMNTDISSLPAGVYFYTLSNGTQKTTKRMIVK